MSSRSKLAACLLAASSLFACETYDSPPVAELQLPEGGAFLEGEKIRISFSEEVAPQSVAVRVWPNVRDIENEFAEGTKPFVESCGTGEECGELEVELTDSDEIELSLGGDLGRPGQPLAIELLPGLEDLAGNATGASTIWDIQFRSGPFMGGDAGPDAGPSVPVEFDDGHYILLAQVDKPLPAVLTLISELRVLPDGRFVLAGAEGDEINGAPKNTRDPENLVVDETNLGFTAHVTGRVTVADDGRRLLESEPFDVTLPVLSSLVVEMEEVRLFGEIVKNEETGKDRLDGTLSFAGLTLINGENENVQPGGSTALIADFVPEDVLPSGVPEICGDLCGAVVEGLCEPPEDFPHPDFCETE